jgi:hypothetical protein
VIRGALTSVGPLFSGGENRANQVSPYESKTRNYFCSTYSLVSHAIHTFHNVSNLGNNNRPHGSWVIIGQTVTICNKK